MASKKSAKGEGEVWGQRITDPALDPARQPKPEAVEEPEALDPARQPQPRAPLHALGAKPAYPNRGLPEESRPEPDGPQREDPDTGDRKKPEQSRRNRKAAP